MQSVIWDVHDWLRDTDSFDVTKGTIRTGIFRTVAEQFLPPNVGIRNSTRVLEQIIENPVVSFDANRRQQHKGS